MLLLVSQHCCLLKAEAYLAYKFCLLNCKKLRLPNGFERQYSGHTTVIAKCSFSSDFAFLLCLMADALFASAARQGPEI